LMMKKILAIFLLLIFPVVSLAAEADKPVWVTAEGESYQGEMDTLKEVKDRARRNAQGRAVETAVGTFVKSHTLVSNSQIAEDLIYAAVRGKITKEEVLSAGWDSKDRSLYKVNIKALVEPIYPEKGGGLSAKLYLSKTDLKEGEDVKIFYSVNEDAYVYIFSVAADGSVTLLLPNANIPDNFTQAGKAHQFPPVDSRIQLKAMFLPNSKEESAEERIKIVATRNKEALLSLGFKEGIFHIYDQKSTGMISDLVRRLNQIELTDWADATAVYTLKKQ
jgi:hypothetical protein